jgi:hypothetical protein
MLQWPYFQNNSDCRRGARLSAHVVKLSYSKARTLNCDVVSPNPNDGAELTGFIRFKFVLTKPTSDYDFCLRHASAHFVNNNAVHTGVALLRPDH